MKTKLKIIILLAVIFTLIFFLLPSLFSNNQVLASEPEFPDGLQIPGRIEGRGTYFEIKDSEYLNITLKSTAEIKVVLESIPRMISLDISSSTDFTSTNLTITCLEPNKTYYKYQDSYKNEVVFTSDEGGSYIWTQNLTQPHYIWFQEEKGTIFLPEQCSTYGIWDPVTLTCNLNQDLNESVEITTNNLTLDCQKYFIRGSGSGIGLWFYEKRGLTIKNCQISNFTYGIYLKRTQDNILFQNSLSNNYGGIYLDLSSNNKLLTNKVFDNKAYGIFIAQTPFNYLRENSIWGNGVNFGVIGNYIQDIDTSNTVEGKPIYYLLNQENKTIDGKSNAGYVGVINSKGIVIKDLDFKNNHQGILLVNSQDSNWHFFLFLFKQ